MNNPQAPSDAYSGLHVKSLHLFSDWFSKGQSESLALVIGFCVIIARAQLEGILEEELFCFIVRLTAVKILFPRFHSKPNTRCEGPHSALIFYSATPMKSIGLQ